jgi:hypothetical protein
MPRIVASFLVATLESASDQRGRLSCPLSVLDSCILSVRMNEDIDVGSSMFAFTTISELGLATEGGARVARAINRCYWLAVVLTLGASNLI